MSSEIFRHLRPLFFDKKRKELLPLKNGGVSFLLHPIGPGTYNYWIYACPPLAPFSAKQAVASLRKVKEAGVVPWGTIKLSSSPILDELSKSVIQEPTFQSEVAHQVLRIVLNNIDAQIKHLEAQSTSIRSAYETD